MAFSRASSGIPDGGKDSINHSDSRVKALNRVRGLMKKAVQGRRDLGGGGEGDMLSKVRTVLFFYEYKFVLP